MKRAPPWKLQFGLSPGQVDTLTQAYLPRDYRPPTHLSMDNIGRKYCEGHTLKSVDIDCNEIPMWFNWTLVINRSSGHHELTHWPMGDVAICLKAPFQTHLRNWYLRLFLQNFGQMTATKFYWWQFKIGSGIGLVPSVLSTISDFICRC